MRLTTTAANSSYGLCRSGLAMSPMKNPRFSVAARTTKNTKTTFSRFTLGPRAAGHVDDLTGDEPGALADQERHRVRDVLRLPGAVDRDPGGPLGHVLL